MFEKISDPTKVRHWYGSMPVSHRYTAGIAGERFFVELRDRGVLLASHCEQDGVRYFPAVSFCERCLRPLDRFIEIAPFGFLESFTIVHRDLEENVLEEPIVIGLIRLEDADTYIVHRVQGFDLEALVIGLPLEALIRPRAKRTGCLGDIDYFGPMSGEGTVAPIRGRRGRSRKGS